MRLNKSQKLKWLALGLILTCLFQLDVIHQISANPGFGGRDLYLDDLPSSAQYVVDTDGTYVWATRYDGKIAYSGTGASTVIQSAINGLTVGGKIFIKAGNYSITTAITLSNNTVFEGEGWATILYQGANIVPVEVKGTASAYKVDWAIRNLQFQGDGSSAKSAIECEYAQRGIIENCFIHSFAGHGIKLLFQTIELSIRQNQIGYTGKTITNCGIHANRSHDLRIIGNDIEHCGGGLYAAIHLYRSPEFQVVGNILEYDGLGIKIQGDVSYVDGGTITGNSLQANARHIDVTPDAGKITISGNDIIITEYIESFLIQSDDIVISGNYFECADDEAIILDGASNCTITGNIFNGCCKGANNTDSVLLLQTRGSTHSTHNLVVGNSFHSAETNKPKYNIYEADSNQDYNSYIGNHCFDAVTCGIKLNGANSHGNLCWNGTSWLP